MIYTPRFALENKQPKQNKGKLVMKKVIAWVALITIPLAVIMYTALYQF